VTGPCKYAGGVSAEARDTVVDVWNEFLSTSEAMMPTGAHVEANCPSPVPLTQPGHFDCKGRTLHMEWPFSDKAFNLSRPLQHSTSGWPFRVLLPILDDRIFVLNAAEKLHIELACRKPARRWKSMTQKEVRELEMKRVSVRSCKSQVKCTQ
jgi:hypothetical protein